jgi:Tol biopolymer transport system component
MGIILLSSVLSACGGTQPTEPDSPRVAANGLIAFPGRDAQGYQQLYTIQADGTDRRQLTFENDNSLPSWSPDGARLVYVSRTPAPNLTIMDEDGGNKRTLVTGDAPDWGPNDQIAYTITDQTGHTVPTPGDPPAEIWVVDAKGGTPRQVTSGGNHGGRVHPSWSPDGKRLVYMQLTPQDPATDDTANGCPALPVRAELWTIDADGSNPRLLSTTGYSNYDTSGQLINSASDANAPDWSPVGDFITFWSGQEQCYGQVWRINADGSPRIQLTKALIPSHNDDPAWSPDGTKILFTTDRRGRPELWLMDADGGNPRFLTESAPGPGPGDPAWQPIRPALVGRQSIAFATCDVTGVSQIVLADPDGGNQRVITQGSLPSWFPAWSPDGARLLFARETSGQNGSPQVWIMNADGSSARVLVADGMSLAGSWSPDGRRIAYAYRPSGPQEGLKIWLALADGSQARRLTGESAATVDENVPRWSPDGTQIAFTSNARGRYEIWVASVDSAEARPLTEAYFDQALQADIEQKVPAWSPNGRLIAYWSGVEGNDPRPNLPRDAWVMNAAGTGRMRLGGGDDPNWSPSGEFIIHSRVQGGQPELAIVRPDGTDARTLFTVNACRPLQSSWTRRP